MQRRFFEATNGVNWGKFLVARFGSEWMVESKIEPGRSLVASQGWSYQHLLVVDLQTGEGAMFRLGGFAAADLNKRRVWVCPLFEPFLDWLYDQDLNELFSRPENESILVEFPETAGTWGGRRPGPAEERLREAARRLVMASKKWARTIEDNAPAREHRLAVEELSEAVDAFDPMLSETTEPED